MKKIIQVGAIVIVALALSGCNKGTMIGAAGGAGVAALSGGSVGAVVASGAVGAAVGTMVAR